MRYARMRGSRIRFLEPDTRSDLQCSVTEFARLRLGLLSLVFLFAGWSQAVRAEVSVPVPESWNSNSDAAREARTRGTDLADRLDAELIQLASTATDDEFIERILVLKRSRSSPATILSDVGAAQEYLSSIIALVHDQLPRDPISPVEIVAGGAAAPVVTGTWATDSGLATRLVVVPAGLSEVLIIMEAQRKELFFFGDVFGFVTENITGAEIPIPPFSSTRWRITTTLILLFAGLASFFGVLLTADRTGAYEKSGRRGSVIMMGVSLLAIAVVFFALRGVDASLEAAGVSSDRLAIEAAITGLAVAGGCYLAGIFLRKDTDKIASAPSHGIYSASSSQTSGVRPMVSTTFTGEEDPNNTSDSSPAILPKSAPSTATSASSSALPVVTPSVPAKPQAPPRTRTNTANKASDSAAGPAKSPGSSSSDAKRPLTPVGTRSSSATPRLNLGTKPGKPKPPSDS